MKKFLIAILVTIGVIATIISSCKEMVNLSAEDKNQCRDTVNKFTQACNSYNPNDAINCLAPATMYELTADIKAKKFSDRKEENAYIFNKIIKSVFDSGFNINYNDLYKMKIEIKKIKPTKQGMEVEAKVSYNNSTKKAKIFIESYQLGAVYWQIDKITLN
jgi:hypothetical protein